MNRILVSIMIIFTLAVSTCSEASKESIAQNKKQASPTVGKPGTTNFTLTFNEGLEKSAKENKNMMS